MCEACELDFVFLTGRFNYVTIDDPYFRQQGGTPEISRPLFHMGRCRFFCGKERLTLERIKIPAKNRPQSKLPVIIPDISATSGPMAHNWVDPIQHCDSGHSRDWAALVTVQPAPPPNQPTPLLKGETSPTTQNSRMMMPTCSSPRKVMLWTRNRRQF